MLYIKISVLKLDVTKFIGKSYNYQNTPRRSAVSSGPPWSFSDPDEKFFAPEPNKGGPAKNLNMKFVLMCKRKKYSALTASYKVIWAWPERVDL